MDDSKLLWTVNGKKTICHTPVFDVIEQKETAADGMTGTYVGIEAPNWVVVVPVHGDCFFMVMVTGIEPSEIYGIELMEYF